LQGVYDDESWLYRDKDSLDQTKPTFRSLYILKSAFFLSEKTVGVVSQSVSQSVGRLVSQLIRVEHAISSLCYEPKRHFQEVQMVFRNEDLKSIPW